MRRSNRLPSSRRGGGSGRREGTAQPLFLCLLGVLLFAPRSLALENPGGRVRRLLERGPVRSAADRLDIDEPAGRAILAGNVTLTIGEREELLLFADAVVVWGRVSQLSVRPVEVAHEIYAEGEVFLTVAGQSFEADALYLDIAAGEGRLARATIRSEGAQSAILSLFSPGSAFAAPARFASTPFLVRADEARMSEGFTLFEAEDVRVSTCTFGVPHYDLAARSARVVVRPGDPDAPADASPAGARAELREPRLDVLGRTAFAWPFGLVWDTDWNRFLPRLRTGRSGRFGYYALGGVPLWESRGLDALAKIDYMSERGGGYGASLAWRDPERGPRSYFGFFDGYFIHDDGEDRSGLSHPEDRGRVRLFHRDDLPFGFRREAELSWISDRGFLPEFYEGEAKTGKEQETVAYLRWLHENMGAMLLGRWRLNDFQTQVEYLPRGRWTWIGQPLLTSILPGGRGVYLTTAYELSNARLRFDDDLPHAFDTDQVQRADFTNRLDWPAPLGALELDPFVEARYTAWSERARSEDAIDRWAVAGGAIATFDAWRDFDVTSSLLGITGLRHIFTPSAGYVRRFYDDVLPQELVRIDAVEESRKVEYVPISIRNRLQAGRGDASVDLVDLLVDTRFFPQTARAETRSLFVPPLAPRRWDTIRGELRVNPTDRIGFRGRVEWDPEGRGVVRQDWSALARLDPAVGVYASWRELEDLYRAVEVGADVRATESWGFFASTQYDFERGTFIRNRLAVRRFYHRFVLEGTIDADFGENDVRFSVSFSPIELFRREGPFAGEIEQQVDPLF